MRRIILMLVGCAFIEAMNIIVPYFDGYLMQAFATGDQSPMATMVVICMAGIGWYLIRSVLPSCTTYLETIFRVHAQRHLLPATARISSTNKLAMLRVQKGTLTPSALQQQAIQFETNVIDFVSIFLRILPQFVGALTTIGLVFKINPQMGVVVICITAPTIAVALLGTKKLKPLLEVQQQLDIAARASHVDVFAALSTGAPQKGSIFACCGATKRYAKQALRAQWVAQRYEMFRNGLSVTAVIAVCFLGYRPVLITHTIEVGIFFMLVAQLWRITDITATVMTLIQKWLTVQPTISLYLSSFQVGSAEEMAELLTAKPIVPAYAADNDNSADKAQARYRRATRAKPATRLISLGTT
jgi:hypothetical protein